MVQRCEYRKAVDFRFHVRIDHARCGQLFTAMYHAVRYTIYPLASDEFTQGTFR